MLIVANTRRLRNPIATMFGTADPQVVLEFKAARWKFVRCLEKQAALIRQQPSPEALAEVRLNMRDPIVALLDEVSMTALYMATDAPDHPYVLAKPFGFYDVGVPAMCVALRRILPVLGTKLQINSKFDMCVHFCIQNILADLGF